MRSAGRPGKSARVPSHWGGDEMPRRSGRHRKDRGCRKSTAAVMLLVLAVVAGLILATGIYVATVIY